MEIVIGVFLTAFAAAYVLTPLAGKLANLIGAVDCPNERKVHTCIIPRMGGLAIYAGFMVSVIMFTPVTQPLFGLLAAATCIVILGIIDDMFELPAKVKLAGQIAAALGFALSTPGNTIDFITNPITGDMFTTGMWAIPMTVIWIVAIVNAVNLIDGLDGLAAGISFISAVVLMFFARTQMNGAVAVILSTAVAGSCLAFLQFNFNPAKIFMGDTGSMFLGFVLAAISVQGTMKSAATIALLVPILALALPIFDTSVAIIRRAIAHKPIFAPDKGHLHHRLLSMGLSQKQTVIIMYIVSALIAVFALTLTKTNGIAAYILTGAIVICLLWVMNKFGLSMLMPPKEKSDSNEESEDK